MKSIKRGLLLAALSLAALTLGSSGAVADPIGRPFTGSGSIQFDGGLGGTDCWALTIEGSDGTAITAVTFAGCTGYLGPATGLVPMAIQWNARNTGGQLAVAYLMNVSGLAWCLYSGSLQFTYNGSTRVITFVKSTIPRLIELSGLPICPLVTEVTGSVTLS